MGDTLKEMNDDWEPLLERYLEHVAEYNVLLGRPAGVPAATPKQIAYLHAEAGKQNVHIDPAIERFLSRVNGLGFNGLWFFAIQVHQKTDLYGRMDIFEANLLIEERENDSLYGKWTDQFFVHVAATGTFERRSIAGWDPYNQYETCDQMLAGIFEEALDYLEDDTTAETP